MSYSNTEMWSLTVRSIVDLRAMASREEWMGWDSCNVWRKTRQGTMALQKEVKRGEKEGISGGQKGAERRMSRIKEDKIA